MPGDDCGRIQRRPRCSVAAEQSCDGLLFGSHIGAGIAGDVDERAEEVGVHHREVTAQVPPVENPATPQLARSALTPRFEIMHCTTLFGQMIGGVAAAPVDAFGVDAERAARIDEHQHRRNPAVGGRECIGRGGCPPDPQPVAGVLISAPTIITTGSLGGGTLANHAGGKYTSSPRC